MRHVQAKVYTQHLLHNLNEAKTVLPGQKVLGVIKADAYGHGLVEIAHILSDHVDALGVATLGEALALKHAGVISPILLMEGPRTLDEWVHIEEHHFDVMLHAPWQLKGLQAISELGAKIWLKIDTGMHRLGFSLDEVAKHLPLLRQKSKNGQICFATHLATADDKGCEETQKQLTLFESFLKKRWQAGDDISFANSAAILQQLKLSDYFPDACFWMRPGIMLYGASPFTSQAAQVNLKPVMELESHLIAIKDLKKGDKVGYGLTYTAGRDMRLGVVACGYGDGFPRHIQQTEVMVGGVHCPVIGRVSMDMITVDLKDARCQIADKVMLWGPSLPVDTLAHNAGTIAYELLCQIKPSQFFYI